MRVLKNMHCLYCRQYFQALSACTCGMEPNPIICLHCKSTSVIETIDITAAFFDLLNQK